MTEEDDPKMPWEPAEDEEQDEGREVSEEEETSPEEAGYGYGV